MDLYRLQMTFFYDQGIFLQQTCRVYLRSQILRQRLKKVTWSVAIVLMSVEMKKEESIYIVEFDIDVEIASGLAFMAARFNCQVLESFPIAEVSTLLRRLVNSSVGWK